MKEYRKYIAEGNQIADGGTQWLTDGDAATYPAHIALVEAGREPTNWADMSVENGELVPASAEVLAARRQAETARRAEALRGERDALLGTTDKYMIPDFPLTEAQREAYRAYRRYLRDLPQTEGFPEVEIAALAEFALAPEITNP